MRLVEIHYNFSSGTMMGEDFFIKISDKEIVSTRFFPNGAEKPEAVTREHIPIDEEVWGLVERLVEALLPELSEKSAEKKAGFFGRLAGKMKSKVEVLDGGDIEDFILTWEEKGALTKKSYYFPKDEKGLELFCMLKEIADS